MIITLQCICSYRFSVMTATIIVPEMFQVPNKLCSGRKAECNIQGASIASLPDLCFDDSSIHGGLHCYPHILPTLLIIWLYLICPPKVFSGIPNFTASPNFYDTGQLFVKSSSNPSGVGIYTSAPGSVGETLLAGDIYRRNTRVYRRKWHQTEQSGSRSRMLTLAASFGFYQLSAVQCQLFNV